MKKLFLIIKWWLKEQENLCPNCGYYCHGKSIYCLPPNYSHNEAYSFAEKLGLPTEFEL